MLRTTVELGERAVVISICEIKMIGAGEMSFTRFGAEPECGPQRLFR